MKIKNCITFCFFCVYLIIYSDFSLLYGSMNKIEIQIGESRSIPLKDEILVSKKGIVDISEQNDTYLITGLKEGTVLISSETYKDQKYFINVYKAKPKTKYLNPSKTSFSNKHSLEWEEISSVCKKDSSITCNKNLDSISGLTKDIGIWKKLKNLCFNTGCDFNLRLEELKFNSIIKLLANRLDPSFMVKHRDQNIYIEIPNCFDDYLTKINIE